MQNSEIISLFKQGCSIDFIAGLVLVELKAKYEHGNLNTKPNRATARKVVEKAIYENIQFCGAKMEREVDDYEIM